MESRSRGRGVGVACKVVAITLPVMTLLVVYVVAVELFLEIGSVTGLSLWLSCSRLLRQNCIAHGAM